MKFVHHRLMQIKCGLGMRPLIGSLVQSATPPLTALSHAYVRSGLLIGDMEGSPLSHCSGMPAFLKPTNIRSL